MNAVANLDALAPFFELPRRDCLYGYEEIVQAARAA
jgi:hypothetical protein